MDIRGRGSPVRQPDEKEWSKTDGWQAVQIWEGTREQIEALGLSLASSGSFTNISTASRDGAVYRLRANVANFGDGSQEEATETWEIDGNTEQLDVFSHYKCDGMAGTDHISQENLSIIKQLIDKPEDWENQGNPAWVTNNVNEAINAQALWNLVKREQRTFQRSFWVLRYSLSGSTALTFNIETPANIDHVFTFAQLPWSSINQTTAVSEFLATLESDSPPYAAPDEYRWGWLLQAPKLAQSYNGKVSVMQEWWYQCWSNFLYDNAV